MSRRKALAHLRACRCGESRGYVSDHIVGISKTTYFGTGRNYWSVDAVVILP
jgi:hypothetical protein